MIQGFWDARLRDAGRETAGHGTRDAGQGMGIGKTTEDPERLFVPFGFLMLRNNVNC